MPLEMKEPSRALLWGSVAVAALLALGGGFLFFTNLPEMGAARSQIMAAEPHLQRTDIDRIIEARNALSPRPTEIASAAPDSGGATGSFKARMPNAARALSAAEARPVSDAVAPAAVFGGMAPDLPPANPGDALAAEGHMKEAVDHWRQDAANGDRWSAYQLAKALLEGRGDALKADPVEGLKWMRVAADKNEPHAQFELGKIYRDGTAAKADPLESARWFLKSAQRGNPDGEAAIAPLLASGRGIDRDRVEALKFYILTGASDTTARSAAARPNEKPNALDGVKALRADMSDAEIKEATRRAAVFQPIQD